MVLQNTSNCRRLLYSFSEYCSISKGDLASFRNFLYATCGIAAHGVLLGVPIDKVGFVFPILASPRRALHDVGKRSLRIPIHDVARSVCLHFIRWEATSWPS